MLILVIVVMVYILFYEITYECLSIFVQRSRKEESTNLEELPPFHQALSDKNLDLWISEEMNTI